MTSMNLQISGKLKHIAKWKRTSFLFAVVSVALVIGILITNMTAGGVGFASFKNIFNLSGNEYDAEITTDMPSTMYVGVPTTFHIIVHNTGTLTWRESSAFRLGLVGDASVMGQSPRVYLPSGVIVSSGQSYTWTLTVTPSSGIYTFNWRMVQDGVTWFGQTASVTVYAVNDVAPDIALSESGWTTGTVTVTANIADVGSGVAVQKWAAGSQTADYFASNGTVFTGSTFDVTTNGVYTVYAADNSGNHTIRTIQVDHIDNVVPSISTTSGNVNSDHSTDINISASDNGSGLSPISINNTTVYARYIRDWTNGNTSNNLDSWVEIEAYQGSSNVALNKSVSTNIPSGSQMGSSISCVTDGNLAANGSNGWFGAWTVSGGQYVTVDLGQVYSINKVTVWHFYGDYRTHHGTKTEVSADGVNWVTLYNNDESDDAAEYSETQLGNTVYPIDVSPVSDGNVVNARYIRDWSNGNTTNPLDSWVEIEAFQGSSNVALNKSVTTNIPNGNHMGTISYVTDGSTNTDNWYGAWTVSGGQFVTVDLGQTYSINSVVVWHYYGDSRTHHGTKTEVSTDGVNWVTLYDNSDKVLNEYSDTPSGHVVYPISASSDVSCIKWAQGNQPASYFANNGNAVTVNARYIRDWTNGNTSNALDSWVEIQAYQGNTNVALRKAVTTNVTGATNSISLVTDGSFATTGGRGYYGNWTVTGGQYVTVDLGKVYPLNSVVVWHYFCDSRTHHNTKTQVSADGVNWVTLYDSSVSGEYRETPMGHAMYPTKLNVTSSGTYTAYIEDIAGNKSTSSFTVDNLVGSDMQSATEINPGVSVNQYISSASCVQYYKINKVSGDDYLEANITDPLVSGKYLQYSVSVYDSSGNLLNSVKSINGTDYIRCKITKPGYYYVEVSGDSNNYNASIPYTLTVK